MLDLDVYLLAREFYAIEAISVMLGRSEYGDFQPMRHSHSRWYQDFRELRDRYVSQFASAIYDYTVLAVAAEMRHAPNCASHYIEDYFSGGHRRNEVYQDCTMYNPDSILTAGFRLFDPQQVEWKQEYGGEKWWHIAKAGLLKGKVSDGVFIDHCVDLSHNNNIYFDKGAGIFVLCDCKTYNSFLNFKLVCETQELTRQAPGYCLNRLLLRADNLQILRGCEIDSDFSGESDETEQQLLNYVPIQWGHKILNRTIRKKVWSGKSQRTDDRYDEDEKDFPFDNAA